MDNIVHIPIRASRPIRLPEPEHEMVVITRSGIQERYERNILEQFRRWFLASEESPGAKEAFLRQLEAFMEPRV